MRSADLMSWGERLEVRETETPRPGPREIRLRLSYCGVCHSDVHVRAGYFDMGGGERANYADRGYELPITIGHEPLGVVDAVGDEVTGVSVGETYLVYPWTGCGTCRFCLRGEDNFCQAPAYIGIGRPGAYATHLLVPDKRYLIDCRGIDPAQACTLACSGLTSYAAVRKLGDIDPQDWVAVVGCGGLGLTGISILRGLGHERVIACDIDDEKLAVAAELGADRTVNLSAGDGAQQLLQISPGGVYGIVDFVGAESTAALAQPSLRSGGLAVIVGLFGGALNVPLPIFGTRGVGFVGSKMGTLQDMREIVELVQQGKVQPPPVQLRRLDEANESLDDIESGRVTGRIVLDLGAECCLGAD